MQKAGEGGEETIEEGLTMRGWVGKTREGPGPGEGLCERRQGGQRPSGGWSPPHLSQVPSATGGRS